MNQGIYFGQMVIGPAGSGKVNKYLPSQLTAKLCKRWQKLLKEISSYSILIPQQSTTHIAVMLVKTVRLRHQGFSHSVGSYGRNVTWPKWRTIILYGVFLAKPIMVLGKIE